MAIRKPKETKDKATARSRGWTVGSPGGRPYKIGYARPPEAYQFKPGQSGNPAGRPSNLERLRRLGLATVLAETLNKKTTIHVAGRKMRVTKLEAMTKTLADRAAAGDASALMSLLGQPSRTAGVSAAKTAAAAIDRLDAADCALVARIILLLAGAA